MADRSVVTGNDVVTQPLQRGPVPALDKLLTRLDLDIGRDP